jgi:ATP-dependent Clp protease ATP-binding subunit ClpB
LILNPLSKEILAGNVERDGLIGIVLDDDNQLSFENLSSMPVDPLLN